MAYWFDGTAKVITLSPGTTSFSVVDLYSRWKEWVLTGDNAKFEPAMRAVGGDPVSDTKSLGATYFMINGWRIRPQEANHRLQISGNLYTDPAGSSPILSTLGNYSVIVELSVSNLIDTVTTGGGGGLNEAQVRSAVWNATTSDYQTPNTFGKLMQGLLTLKQFLGLGK